MILKLLFEGMTSPDHILYIHFRILRYKVHGIENRAALWEFNSQLHPRVVGVTISPSTSRLCQVHSLDNVFDADRILGYRHRCLCPAFPSNITSLMYTLACAMTSRIIWSFFLSSRHMYIPRDNKRANHLKKKLDRLTSIKTVNSQFAQIERRQWIQGSYVTINSRDWSRAPTVDTAPTILLSFKIKISPLYLTAEVTWE